jgi:hypothetical protein
MHADPHEQLRELAEQHGLKAVPGRKIGCVRFEKPGLSVETCNFEDFTVVHGGTQRECPDLTDLARYLAGL